MDFNSQKNAQATTDFEKDFFNLMVNACFGKFLENLRERKNIQLFSDEWLAQRRIAKSSFVEFRIFNENLIAIHSI